MVLDHLPICFRCSYRDLLQTSLSQSVLLENHSRVEDSYLFFKQTLKITVGLVSFHLSGGRREASVQHTSQNHVLFPRDKSAEDGKLNHLTLLPSRHEHPGQSGPQQGMTPRRHGRFPCRATAGDINLPITGTAEQGGDGNSAPPPKGAPHHRQSVGGSRGPAATAKPRKPPAKPPAPGDRRPGREASKKA